MNSGLLGAICKPLYGRRPTGIGNSIVKLFEWLAQTIPESEAGMIENTCRPLKLFITSEQDTVASEKEVCQRRKFEQFMYERGSDWLPGSANFNRVLAQDGGLDRQIDNKVKLLVRLQSLRPKAEALFDSSDAIATAEK